ncbi:MAG: polymer-forming cytoskeletal protein [bacterium]|nr:polymer-forming cytoskeletal protein [bacterium]
MFTKTRGDEPHQTNAPAPNVPNVGPKPKRSADGRPASLGPSISVSGNLSGNEDLIIEGAVEGEVVVKDHMVTISETGKVKADVYGRSICVEGQVDGNLVGDEQVVIRQSGRVRGNVTAPRVNLENGAKFKGSIDMQPTESAPAKPDGAKKPNAGTKEERRPSAAKISTGATAVGETV